MKPQKSGTEIDAAPMIQNPVVHGIDLNNPPKWEPLISPVRKSTAPNPIKSNPL